MELGVVVSHVGVEKFERFDVGVVVVLVGELVVVLFEAFVEKLGNGGYTSG